MLNHITLISNDVFHFGNRNLVSRHKCDLVQLASLKFFYIDVIMHLFSWIPSTQSFRMYVNFLPSFLRVLKHNLLLSSRGQVSQYSASGEYIGTFEEFLIYNCTISIYCIIEPSHTLVTCQHLMLK
jgi:hypothetical protein